MSEISQQRWTDCSVGKVAAPNGWFSDDCKQLTVVSHVCHVLTALDVLLTGSIKPQLIYDESRLNTKCILVVWLSPNDWSGAGGCRYGNISFDLDWAKLIEGKRFYWVGVAEYKPKACRILLTEKDRYSQLLPYRPRKGDGPWWDRHKEGEHRWNGDSCLELMVEEEISPSDIKELRFVKHHPKRCSMKNQGCRDKGHDAWKGGARLRLFDWKFEEVLTRGGGRHPSGPEFVERLAGSPAAKERLQVVLETLAGTCRVGAACARLGIKETRFEQVRIDILQAALATAEQGPAGRQPRQPDPHDAEVQQLRQRVAQLEAQLQAALLRAEVAVLLRQVGDTSGKNRQRRRPDRGHDGHGSNREPSAATMPGGGRRRTAPARHRPVRPARARTAGTAPRPRRQPADQRAGLVLDTDQPVAAPFRTDHARLAARLCAGPTARISPGPAAPGRQPPRAQRGHPPAR